MQTKSAELEGINMRWEEDGEGTPVVYVHGIPTSPRLWRHVIPQVENARSLAWEMVGYGGSIEAGRDRDISVAHQADYLASWMRELGLENAVLVGHDLGGGVVQILAVRHPELVSGIVLTNAICYDSWPMPQVKLLQAMRSMVERLPDEVFRIVYTSFMLQGHGDRRQAQEAVSEHFPYYERADGAAALLRQVRSLDAGLLKAKYDQPFAKTWNEVIASYLASDAINVLTAVFAVLAYPASAPPVQRLTSPTQRPIPAASFR